MKTRLMSLADKLLLRRRAIIESVIDQLKNISQIVRVSVPKANILVTVHQSTAWSIWSAD